MLHMIQKNTPSQSSSLHHAITIQQRRKRRPPSWVCSFFAVFISTVIVYNGISLNRQAMADHEQMMGMQPQQRKRQPSSSVIPRSYRGLNVWENGNHTFVQRHGSNTLVHSYATYNTLGVRQERPLNPNIHDDGSFSKTTGDDVLAVRLVYFVNTKIPRSNYTDWMYHQFEILKPNFQDIQQIFIVATAKSCTRQKQDHLDAFLHWLESHHDVSSVTLECRDEVTQETFEYHGIHKVWSLSQSHYSPNDIVIYFHSKGLTHASSWKTYQNRQGPEFQTTQFVLGHDAFRRALDALRVFPTVDKIGWDHTTTGFEWYNFWYARGSYLNQVERPLQKVRRHYYEDWLKRWGAGNAIKERPRAAYKFTGDGCYALAASSSSKFGDTTTANLGYYRPQQASKGRQLVDVNKILKFVTIIGTAEAFNCSPTTWYCGCKIREF